MNGSERNLSTFRKLSAYIMQDNQLHGNLTVQEAMTVATNLKLSKKFTKLEKNSMVNNEYHKTNSSQQQSVCQLCAHSNAKAQIIQRTTQASESKD